jgi:D-alanyl-D-alanine carboxypeptidase
MRPALILACCALALVSCASGSGSAQAPEPPTVTGDASPESFLEGQLARLGTPSEGAILLTWTDGGGETFFVSAGESEGHLLSPTDPIRIASLTKAFTAALILDLVVDGLAGLDDSAAQHLSRIDVPEEVTIAHLLSHRSGLPDYVPDTPLVGTPDGERKAWSPEELFALVADEGLDFEPGSRFAYNNTNFLVLAVIAEEITGDPYHVSLRERILEPLSLNSTYLAHYETGEEPVPGFSQAGQAAGRVGSTAGWNHTALETASWAAAALISTVEDVTRFFEALGSAELFSEELVSAMLDADPIPKGGDGPIDRYAYGLGVELFDASETVFGIRGDYPGYVTLVMHSPDDAETWMFVSTNDRFRYTTIVPEAVRRIAG